MDEFNSKVRPARRQRGREFRRVNAVGHPALRVAAWEFARVYLLRAVTGRARCEPPGPSES